MRVDNVTGNVPGKYCSPCHRLALNSRDEGLKRVAMTWHAMTCRPYVPFMLPLLTPMLVPARDMPKSASFTCAFFDGASPERHEHFDASKR